MVSLASLTVKTQHAPVSHRPIDQAKLLCPAVDAAAAGRVLRRVDGRRRGGCCRDYAGRGALRNVRIRSCSRRVRYDGCRDNATATDADADAGAERADGPPGSAARCSSVQSGAIQRCGALAAATATVRTDIGWWSGLRPGWTGRFPTGLRRQRRRRTKLRRARRLRIRAQ
jgi:hypothetical protein